MSESSEDGVFQSDSGYVHFAIIPYPDELHDTVLQEIRDLRDGLSDILDKQEQRRQMYALYGDDKP